MVNLGEFPASMPSIMPPRRASAIHDYIEHFHNTRRRHSALGMLTPTEYEDLHNATQAA
jgi:transposase InsO family protein